MRLNGKTELLMYLGRNIKNKRTWRRLRARYAAVILCEPGTGHIWADSADLDAIDRKRCVPMADFLSRRPKGDPVGDDVGGYPRQYQRLLKRMFKPGARGSG